MGLVIVLLLAALLLVVGGLWLAAAVYVLSDAQKRQLPNAWLWGLGTLVSGPVGLIAYLVDRPPSRRTPCSFCGEMILETDVRCPYCSRECQGGFPHGASSR